MILDKKILAVVPARGGSKGVPRKNLYPLNGIPLVAHTAAFLKQLPFIDRSVVSTDDPEIAETCEKWGLSCPFFRPPELSGDRIGDLPVLAHALTTMEMIDETTYDVIVMLQPTCPERSIEHVTNSLNLLIERELDSVWTVSPADLKYHPLKAIRVDSNGMLSLYQQSGASIIARQQLEQLYYRNGAAYVIRRHLLMNEHSLIGRKSAAHIISTPLISIDTLDDFSKIEKRGNFITSSYVDSPERHR
jgi:CMP-N,N'-diacetyllegionaminic acid synthase